MKLARCFQIILHTNAVNLQVFALKQIAKENMLEKNTLNFQISLEVIGMQQDH